MTVRQRAMLNQRVIVEVWSGADGYGKPTFLAPHTFACRITEEPDYVRRMGDPSVDAKSGIWMDVQDTGTPPVLMSTLITQAQGTSSPAPTEAVILGSSKVTLPDGSHPPVLRFTKMADGAGNVHHYVIYSG